MAGKGKIKAAAIVSDSQFLRVAQFTYGSQRDAAKALGISRSTFQRYVGGKSMSDRTQAKVLSGFVHLKPAMKQAMKTGLDYMQTLTPNQIKNLQTAQTRVTSRKTTAIESKQILKEYGPNPSSGEVAQYKRRKAGKRFQRAMRVYEEEEYVDYEDVLYE